MRYLVVCGNLVLAGGLVRFEKVGRVLRRWGHTLAFVALGDRTQDHWTSDCPVMSLDDAESAQWDAVMVPGGGHPESVFARLSRFRHPRFGLRLQHFLNGPHRKPAYLRVTEPFDPHAIIVNNQHWRAEDFAGFGTRPVERLVGAVDTALFAPPVVRPARIGRHRLGAIANKNPQMVLEALDCLGAGWELHWFGRPDTALLLRRRDLLASGRLVLHGVLFDEALAAFYQSLDAFCSAETFAGWCNPAAEAMACGTPLVTSPHGTLAFAHHGQTALVPEVMSGPAIAEAAARLVADPDAASQLAQRGRSAIRDLTWETYTAALVQLTEELRRR